MSEETVEVVVRPDDIGFSITSAISPRSIWTRVEVESKVLLVLLGRLFGKLEVALEEIVFTTP